MSPAEEDAAIQRRLRRFPQTEGTLEELAAFLGLGPEVVERIRREQKPTANGEGEPRG